MSWKALIFMVPNSLRLFLILCHNATHIPKESSYMQDYLYIDAVYILSIVHTYIRTVSSTMGIFRPVDLYKTCSLIAFSPYFHLFT